MENRKKEPHLIVYRTGGTDNCTWKQTIAYPSRAKAFEEAKDIERMGYKTLVKTVSEVQEIGLPVGWEP